MQWAVQPTDALPLQLWNGKLRKIPSVSKNNFDFPRFCLNFAKYGVTTIEDVEPTSEATKALCLSIAPIHNTFFGDFWLFGTDDEEKVCLSGSHRQER